MSRTKETYKSRSGLTLVAWNGRVASYVDHELAVDRKTTWAEAAPEGVSGAVVEVGR